MLERPADEMPDPRELVEIGPLDVLAAAGLTPDEVYAAHAFSEAAPTDPLEQRVQELERRVRELEKPYGNGWR